MNAASQSSISSPRFLVFGLSLVVLAALLGMAGKGLASSIPPRTYYAVQAASAVDGQVCTGEQVMLSLFVLGGGENAPLSGGRLTIHQSDPFAGALADSTVDVAGGLAFLTYNVFDRGPGALTRTDVLTFDVNGIPASGALPVISRPCPGGASAVHSAQGGGRSALEGAMPVSGFSGLLSSTSRLGEPGEAVSPD